MLTLPDDLGPGPLGVALSGGGDSMALLHLCHARGLRVEAATVDHRLRPESGAEAARVAAHCRTLGIPHRTLVWRHDAIPGNLMAEASRARMALLGAWGRGRGLSAILLAHTADDQAETLLMGLARAAGIDGLCGMRADWRAGGMRWLRPLLMAGRDDLRRWLGARGVSWIDDPTNDDDRFARVRMREALRELAGLGLTPARLAASTAHLAAARQALDAGVAEAARRVCSERAGALHLDLPRLSALPDEIRRRLMRAALCWLSGRRHPPRGAALERFITALLSNRPAALMGCHFRDNWLARELAAIECTREREPADETASGGRDSRPGAGHGSESALWDGRWHVARLSGTRIGPLGARGLAAIPDWRRAGLPRHVLMVTPALWRDDRLIAAPLADFGVPVRAACRPSFAVSLMTH